MESGAAHSDKNSVTPFRGDATKFLYCFGATSPDAAQHPEISYCTIASTGVNAAITKNTGVTFRTGSSNSKQKGGVAVEDPATDGTFWTLGTNSTNNRMQLVKFTISGTTPTASAHYGLAADAETVDLDVIAVDKKDGGFGVYVHNTAGVMSFMDVSSGVPITIGSTKAAPWTVADRVPIFQSAGAGWYGGVLAQTPLLDIANQDAYRFSLADMKGDGTPQSPVVDREQGTPDAKFTSNTFFGTPPSFNSSNATFINYYMDLHLGSSANRQDWDNPMLCFAWKFDSSYDVVENIWLFEIGTATRRRG